MLHFRTELQARDFIVCRGTLRKSHHKHRVGLLVLLLDHDHCAEASLPRKCRNLLQGISLPLEKLTVWNREAELLHEQEGALTGVLVRTHNHSLRFVVGNSNLVKSIISLKFGITLVNTRISRSLVLDSDRFLHILSSFGVLATESPGC